MKIHIEDIFGISKETKGEFVEPVHLQIVCQRIWSRLLSQGLSKIVSEDLKNFDAALLDFYEEAEPQKIVV